MNKEQLIAKNVKHAFNGKETLFSVESLEKHFDGLVIHESDILTDEFEDQDEGYVRAGDVNFDSAIPKEVLEPEEDVVEESTGMSFEEADKLAKEGFLIALPEWEGFWFRNVTKDNGLLVFTKDGEILDTPDEKYKEREDWIEVKASVEQWAKLTEYFDNETAKEITVKGSVVESPDPKAVKEESGKTLMDKLVEFQDKTNIEELKVQQILLGEKPEGKSINIEDLKEEPTKESKSIKK